MWEHLQFVSFKTLQDAMIEAKVPDAASTSWKIDLINLAIEHRYKYVCSQRRLTKAPQVAAIALHPSVVSAPPAPQPIRLSKSAQLALSRLRDGEGQPYNPLSDFEVGPLVSALQGAVLSHFGSAFALEHLVARDAVEASRYLPFAQGQPSVAGAISCLEQPRVERPLPANVQIPTIASVVSSTPAPAVSRELKRSRAVVSALPAVIVPAVPSNHAMGVAGLLKSLYEAKWTQVFSPTPLARGFAFPGEFSFEEIRVHIQKTALDSGCLFWKTDSGQTVSSDGYIHSMSFQCPHFPDATYYHEKKGRKNTEDSAESWRNEPRRGLHVTGTKCQARFTINGKKSESSESKFVWRVSPFTRAKFSMEHSGHPEPHAKY